MIDITSRVRHAHLYGDGYELTLAVEVEQTDGCADVAMLGVLVKGRYPGEHLIVRHVHAAVLNNNKPDSNQDTNILRHAAAKTNNRSM